MKLNFNFFLPIGRLIGLVFYLFCLKLLIEQVFNKGFKIFSDIPGFLYVLFLVSLFSFAAYRFTRGLFKEVQFVKFTEQGISIVNPIQFKKVFIIKNDIEGIYNTTVPFIKGSNSIALLIRTNKGEKYILAGHNYFGFKKSIQKLKTHKLPFK